MLCPNSRVREESLQWINCGRLGDCLTWLRRRVLLATGDCFICEGVRGQDDRRNLVAVRTPHAVVLLNRFPYNNGHLLVAPQSHKGQLRELDRGRNAGHDGDRQPDGRSS